VHLSELSLRHFRNLGSQELAFPAQGIALVGENAQGKSNLLEAIYYLETFRSFRGARDDQLVAFDQDVFRVVGHLCPDPGEDSPDVTVTAAFQKRGRQKKVTVNGEVQERLGDAIGRAGAVIFSPADVALVNEGPGERRRFLDIVLSLNASGYLDALQRYRHVLNQRNAALKERLPDAAVRVWDEPLVRTGARVMEGRRNWLVERGPLFARYYEEVADGQRAALEYRPSVSVDENGDGGPAGAPAGFGAGVEAGVARLEASFRQALTDTGDRERRSGYTVVGPHRDEVRFYLEGDRDLDIRDFGSGGQRRTVALALRLAEAATIREARGREPLILLDDVFAELDAGRSERILEIMEREETGQVILTAPKEADVRFRSDVLPRWHIAGGRIQA